MVTRIRRYAQIVDVLSQYGFGIGIERLFPGKTKFQLPSTGKSIDPLTVYERMRLVLEDLGPTFVKFGQIMSTRAELLPPELIEQFKKQVEQETEKLVATTVAQTKNEVATIQANTALEVAATNLLKATVQAQITQVQGEAKVKAEYTVANEKALGEQMRAGVFKNSATLAELTFVEALNPEAGIRIIHAGEGTLWTDLKTLAPALPVKK